MRDSVRSARYSSVCNVLCQWRIWLIPTYRVGRLYDIFLFCQHNIKEIIIIYYVKKNYSREPREINM